MIKTRISPVRAGLRVSLALAAAQFAAAAPSGLIHHWNFDEGPDWHDSPFQTVCGESIARDSMGAAHATLQNMAASAWVSGRQFTALQFDGVNDHLVLAANVAGTLGGTASFSFWVRTTQSGAATAATAPGIAGAAGSGGTQWGWLDESGRLGLSIDDSLVVRTAYAVNDGNWHHVVITRDADTGVAQIYLDGLMSGSATGASGVRNKSITSLARIEAGEASAHFAGRLDQLHVFNRVVSSTEVATLMANHAPKCWDILTDGVNNRAFTTASIYSRVYDVENDPVTVNSWSQPAHGTVTHNGDGSFTYTANSGFTGNDGFTVEVEDGRGGFHRANMRVSVTNEPAGGGGVPVTEFTNFAALQANAADISHNGWRVPRAVDWDSDGRLDLLVGAGGYVWRYMNTGTPTVPVFAAAVKVQAAGADIHAGTGSSPIALMDMTGDGINDLVLADSASKLRVYRNTAAANVAPVYAAATFVKNTSGADHVLADRRFDLGDWDGDGDPDLVTGTFSGNIQLFLNTGTNAAPRFSTGTVLFSDSYQIYPRLVDLSGNGRVDLLRGINWGSILYWRDAGSAGLANPATLAISYSTGVGVDVKPVTDGAVVDFGDYNGDGKPDILIGGHASDKVFLATGVQKSVAESIAEIEAIYDIDPNNVGVTLSANSDAYLNAVNNANRNIISFIQNGTLSKREAVYAALSTHINKYPFLKYQTLDTAKFHHVPSIVLQNWVMLQSALADTPARRVITADVMGLTGTMRAIFLETGLALGDNAKSLAATYNTIRDFQRRHPRELFPDAVLTTDQLYGDGRGGFVWTPNSTKNTFGQGSLGNSNEWAGDLTTAIEQVLGTGAASGDYFTFVMGHEVTHSLDGYVNSRANADLRKRWGLMLCTAAGADIVPGANGWIDWTATKANFQAKGYWDGVAANWDAAWTAYWATGPGAAFKELSFMRFDISWFLANSQESLATQANHHWANGPGRLIGALARFRRATTDNLPPLKANINEVITFIDFISAGMNRVNLVETKNPTGSQVNWTNHYADIERDDRGYITRLRVDNLIYHFTVDARGVVIDVSTAPAFKAKETGKANAVPGSAYVASLLADVTDLDGDVLSFAKLSGPAWLTVASSGTLTGTPTTADIGISAIIVRVNDTHGGSDIARVLIAVDTATAAYGTLKGNNSGDEFIQRVQFGGIDKTSGNNGGYADFTAIAAQVNPGQSVAYTLTPGWTSTRYNEAWTVWIDYNRDGDFADSGEKVLQTTSSQNSPAGSLTIPATAALGATRMRVAMCYNSAYTSPTGSFTYGEVEDYTVRVGPAPMINSAPHFLAAPLAKPDQLQFVPISGSLAIHTADWENQSITFSKITGPDWLVVDGNGELSGTPVTSHLGANVFTVRATDSLGAHTDATLAINVISNDTNGNGILDTWETNHFGTVDPAAHPANGDVDHDGISNLMEFALGTEPLIHNTNPIIVDFVPLVDGEHLRMTVSKNPLAANLQLTVQTSGDLAEESWSSVATVTESAPLDAVLRVRDTLSTSSAGRRFIRLMISVQ